MTTAPAPAGTEPRRSRALLITLAVVGVALLVALVVLIVVLLNRGSGAVAAPTASPSASVTATPTASPTATATSKPHTTSTPTPAAPAPTTDSGTNGGSGTPALSLSLSTSTGTVYCNTQAPAGQPPLALSFSWTSKGASAVFFGVDTADAQSGALFDQLPPNGSEADFPYEVDFPCPQASQNYTVTVVDGSGGKVSKTVTVVNGGDTQ